MTRLLRIGTRGNRLALVQAEFVAEKLRAAHPKLLVETRTIETAGERGAVPSPGANTGEFTRAVQAALLQGDADIAVHSYKDLPTTRPDGLAIAAVPLRADARDALASSRKATLLGLPPSAVVATRSLRRTAQIRAIRPDIVIRETCGDIEACLATLDSRGCDAVIGALAEFRWLGLEERVAQVLGFEEMLPAPAQGALAIECRAGDTDIRSLLRPVDVPDLRTTLTAERVFLATLDAGFARTAGAHATLFGSTLKLNGLIAAGDGRIIRSKMAGPAEAAAGLGRSLAEELMELARR